VGIYFDGRPITQKNDFFWRKVNSQNGDKNKTDVFIIYIY